MAAKNRLLLLLLLLLLRAPVVEVGEEKQRGPLSLGRRSKNISLYSGANMCPGDKHLSPMRIRPYLVNVCPYLRPVGWVERVGGSKP